MNSVYEYFKERSDGLDLYPQNEEPIPTPTNFRELSYGILSNQPGILNSLIECYQHVFGASDVWGEGAICSKCKSIVPIEDYRVLIQQNKDNCNRNDCGGILLPFYPKEELKFRILREMDPNEYYLPFCLAMFDAMRQDKVVGFCWGVIDTISQISRRIRQNRYANNPSLGEKIENQLAEHFGSQNKILFFDEVGVRRDYRGGIGPVVYLTRLGFAKSLQRKSTSAIFWTSTKSPIYKICILSGFVETIKTPDDLVFLYLDDFVPLLKVMQNNTIEGDAKILLEANKFIG